MGIRPGKYCPRVAGLEPAQLAAALITAKAAIQGMVARLPPHEHFLPSR
jgi:hypothetical protein